MSVSNRQINPHAVCFELGKTCWNKVRNNTSLCAPESCPEIPVYGYQASAIHDAVCLDYIAIIRGATAHQRLALLIRPIGCEANTRTIALHDFTRAVSAAKQTDGIAVVPTLTQADVAIGVGAVVHAIERQRCTWQIEVYFLPEFVTR